MRVAKDVTELIGKTPVLALDRLYSDSGAKVFAKLELLNPMSVKDRPVLNMIREAMARGEIDSSTEVVDASSGDCGGDTRVSSDLTGSFDGPERLIRAMGRSGAARGAMWDPRVPDGGQAPPNSSLGSRRAALAPPIRTWPEAGLFCPAAASRF